MPPMTRLTHPNMASIPRREWLMAAMMVLMALGLRVYTFGFNHFRGDEAGLVSIAQQMLSEHRLPLLGINSSVLVPNSPASIYLIALPYLVVKNPLLATDFVALLNAIGVGLLWLLARQMFSPAVGLVAALIYAANPWAIWFSSKIWEQNLYTPLVILGLLLGWWGYMEGRRWAQALCWPIMIFGLQMHYAGWTLLPLLLLLVAAGRRRIWLPALAAGLLLASLTLAPFTLGLQQNSASDVYSGSHIASILKQIPPSLSHLSGQGMTALTWLSSGGGLDGDV